MRTFHVLSGMNLVGHEVSTVGQVGWAGIRNGTFLTLATSAGFEAIVTCDRDMQFQQNTSTLTLALIVLAVPNNRLNTIQPLVPEIMARLDEGPQPGTVTVVDNWR